MNVLLILADDMRADLLPFMPFVNSLRRAGAMFHGARCSVPLCSPSRAALASGQWAHRAGNGVYENDLSDVADPANDALPVWLQDAGVHTGFIGKYTVPGQTTSPGGWDEWTVLSPGTQSAYGYTARNIAGTDITPSPRPHQLTYLTGIASTFVGSAPEPWFCHFAPTNPHVDANTFLNNPLPASLNRYSWLHWPLDLLTDTTGKPTWIQALSQFSYADQSLIRRNIRQQVREARDLDAAVETICSGIDLGDTLVIFTSDSGVHYGEHRLGGLFCSNKGTPYECAMRAPLVIAGPGFTAGTEHLEPVVLQDVTATIVDALDAVPTLALDGDSLLDPLASDRAILYENQDGVDSVPNGAGVVTTTRKLMRWDGETGTDEYEMYDLDTDPREKINVANVGGRLAERNALEVILDGLLA